MFGNGGLALPVCCFLLLHLPFLPLTNNWPVKSSRQRLTDILQSDWMNSHTLRKSDEQVIVLVHIQYFTVSFIFILLNHP
ncbi:hypothetical protein PAMP_004330 [Pampus punctatissimus]